MSRTIQILLIEDDTSDAELVKYSLSQMGVTHRLERVKTEEELKESLSESPPDIILSDYYLPGFDGMEALQIARKSLPDVPFIFVTGSLGEERAIETFKSGATDYVLKARLSHLVPAVLRAIREADERKERRRTEARLRESREQLRALSVYLQYVREEERTRISREVHDELGQSLTALKLDLAWLSTRLPPKAPEMKEKVRAMAKYIDSTIHAVRRIATELRPGILDDLGLVAALEWQAHEFQQRTGIECEVTSTLQHTVLDADLNTAFFRIFQETLTNVMRHAWATRVTVHSTEKGGNLILEVADNGRGITPDEISNTGSIGLLGMRERAALLGGTVRFASEPGRGTTVTVTIPKVHALPPKKAKATHENIGSR